MDAQSRDQAAALTLLFERPSEFELFQAIRLLQRLRPGFSRVGGFNAPETEALRLRTDPSMACPASLVRAVSSPDGTASGPVQLTTAGFQLTGYSGVLPYFYSRLLAGAGHAYLDTFVHRLLSLQYRAWEKHRLHLAVENAGPETRRRAIGRVLALLGTRSTEGGESSHARLAVQHANVRLGAPRSSIGLKQILEDVCAVPVEIEQFRLKRIIVAGEDRARLGAGRARRRLDDGVIGSFMWHAGSALRIVLGPMSNRDYERLLPGGAAFRDVTVMVRRFVGPAISDIDIELRLWKSEASRPRLSGPRRGAVREDLEMVPSIQTRLGRYGWLPAVAPRDGSRADSARPSSQCGYHAAVFRCADATSAREGRVAAS